MRGHGCEVDWGFIVGLVRDGEIGETGDAYGWRLGNRSHGDCVYFWGGDRIERRGLRRGDLRFEICTWKSQRCDDGSRGGILLTCRFRLADCECRWGREALPIAIP